MPPPPKPGQQALGVSLEPESPSHQRPAEGTWWGMGDIALGAVFILGVAIIGAGVALLLFSGGDTTTGFIVVATLFQQAAMIGWPFIVSRWKGTTPARDWGFSFQKWDPLIGFGVGILGMISAALISQLLSMLLDVPADAGDNTAILTDSSSSPWIVGIVFMVVIGAPFSEELFFRGLCLRSIDRRFGPVVGILGSTVLFTVIHFSDVSDSFRNLAMLWASIGAIGAIFAVVAQLFGRLGPSIFAHMTLNGIATLLTLVPESLFDGALGG